jgi:hypothetical protein
LVVSALSTLTIALQARIAVATRKTAAKGERATKIMNLELDKLETCSITPF